MISNCGYFVSKTWFKSLFRYIRIRFGMVICESIDQKNL